MHGVAMISNTLYTRTCVDEKEKENRVRENISNKGRRCRVASMNMNVLKTIDPPSEFMILLPLHTNPGVHVTHIEDPN